MGKYPLTDPSESALLDHLFFLAGCEDPAFAVEVLEAFLQSSGESAALLEDAMQRPDAGHIARIAHRMKSSFSTLSMEAGVDACARLEELAQSHADCLDEAAREVVQHQQAEAARARRLLGVLRTWDV